MTAHADRFDRYLAIVNWARARYTIDGVLVLSIGGTQGIYKRIETAAFQKYLAG